TISIMKKRRIIAGPVVFAVARRAVVFGAVCKRGFVKVFNLIFILCAKSKMQRHDSLFVGANPKVGIFFIAAVAKARSLAILHGLLVTECRQHFGVKILCLLIITNRNRGVGYHIKYNFKANEPILTYRSNLLHE